MTALRQHQTRVPLRAKPRPDIDAKQAVDQAFAQFPKTLEYLGR